MDDNCSADRIGNAIRKKRTHASRRPKPDYSPLSTSTPSDEIGNGSSDDDNGLNPRRKEVNVNQFVNRVYSGSKTEDGRIRVNNEGEFKEFYNNEPGRGLFVNKRSSEGVLAPANWKSSKTVELMNGDMKGESYYSGRNSESYGIEQNRTSDASGSDNKVKKVKLKVGGVTRTIQANPTVNGAPHLKGAYMSDSSISDQRLDTKVYLEENHFTYSKRPGLQGIPWKDFSRVGFSLLAKDSLGTTPTKNTPARQGVKSEPARKSKRVLKRRSLDGEFGEDYEDDEIRYLEKLKGPKMLSGEMKEDDVHSRYKQRKISSVTKVGALKLKDGKKASTEDVDYEDDEELASETDTEGVKAKKQKKDSDSPVDGGRGIALTTRQRALQSSKEGSAPSGGNLIEYPEGLPPAAPRKQKEKLTEMEQQLKKAEAAERRRVQNEKAARESEAEAIRKILGQDSGRKKREDKIKKRQEVRAQEKAASSLTVASNTVRWVMGPSGTVVTFPSDMDLPNIFNSTPLSYPPLRETCAGPSCTNPYRYRDSKSKLPLCSLQCYKAVQVQAPTGTTC